VDRRFLLEVCEGYFIDNNIYREFDKQQVKLIKETIINDVLSIVQELREDNIEIYNLLWDRSKVTQQQIISEYLDLQYKQLDPTDDEITPLNEGFLEPLLTAVGSAFDFIISKGASIALATASSWTGILAGIIVFILGRKVITKKIFEFISGVGKLMSGIGKLLVSGGKKSTFTYAILHQTTKECYRNCSITPDMVDFLHYWSVKKEASWLATGRTHEVGHCLARCYINAIVETIALLSQYYFNCLKNADDVDVISQVNSSTPDKLMSVLVGLNLSSACNEYLVNLQEAYQKLGLLLDFIYEDDQKSKADWANRIKQRIFESKDQVFNKPQSRPQPNNNFNKPQTNQQKPNNNFNKPQTNQQKPPNQGFNRPY